MATLLLRLAGPLQVWGAESKFETRRTLSYPTKSGVIGMIAAALGRSREDSLDNLNTLKFGVRIDREGQLLCDYHTVISKKTYITNRNYLSDAIFLAGLESSDTELLAVIEAAMKNPVFPLFLGRRSCPPTMPLILGIRDTDLLTALRNEPWLLAEWRQSRTYYDSERRLRIITESDSANGSSVLRDQPLSFNPVYRKFGWRNITEHGYLYMKPQDYDIESTNHDPMLELE